MFSTLFTYFSKEIEIPRAAQVSIAHCSEAALRFVLRLANQLPKHYWLIMAKLTRLRRRSCSAQGKRTWHPGMAESCIVINGLAQIFSQSGSQET